MNRQFTTWHPGGHQLGGGGRRGGGGRGGGGRITYHPGGHQLGWGVPRLGGPGEAEDDNLDIGVVDDKDDYSETIPERTLTQQTLIPRTSGSDYSGKVDSQEVDDDIAGLNRRRSRGRGRTRRSGSSSSGGYDLGRIHHGTPSSSWPYGLPKGGIPDPAPPGGYLQPPNWVTGSR